MDLEGLARLGVDTQLWALDPIEGETQDELERRQSKAKRDRIRAQHKFREEIQRRHDDAFAAGGKAASDMASRTAANARTLALYLVILAVVLMPFVAILIDLESEAFGAYIAPVTAIAGTVVGYWFGIAGRQTGGTRKG